VIRSGWCSGTYSELHSQCVSASDPRVDEVERFGVSSGGGTPGPFSNPVVKPTRADGTGGAVLWETRSTPTLSTSLYLLPTLFLPPYPLHSLIQRLFDLILYTNQGVDSSARPALKAILLTLRRAVQFWAIMEKESGVWGLVSRDHQCYNAPHLGRVAQLVRAHGSHP
jgi:hypothetical protein